MATIGQPQSWNFFKLVGLKQAPNQMSSASHPSPSTDITSFSFSSSSAQTIFTEAEIKQSPLCIVHSLPIQVQEERCKLFLGQLQCMVHCEQLTNHKQSHRKCLAILRKKNKKVAPVVENAACSHILRTGGYASLPLLLMHHGKFYVCDCTV